MRVNPAPRSIGLMMLLYAAIAAGLSVDQHRSPGVLGVVVIAGLLAGGILMLLRRKAAFWVGLAAGLISVVAGLFHARLPVGWRLPIQPILPIVMGLYVSLRVALARSALARQPAQTPRSAMECPPSQDDPFGTT